ncbi:GDSL-type esterase/lipase family protein [Sporolactobacillus kofuensis]|uniref:GDSL-type esterase/lipase family protein n=1 Tax=Sporolactobacillus kofuensis TaxID=269672 RepID=A0ABW1WGS1_9BACL|nr:GDSL-type esterase/lipase family protein [Sporolactobacillus kofuensis]MCO7176064.1 GDSL-type esterase/lipase family protein [Sporolactobacillus kofuensis]
MSARPLYVALGDSLTVGVGSTLFQPNFVKLYQQALEAYCQMPIMKRVFAKNGATTVDLFSYSQQPNVREAIQHAQFITLTGGGNDFLRAGRHWLRTGDFSAVRLASQQSLFYIEQMIQRITALHSEQSAPYMIRILNLYNPLFYIPNTNEWLEDYNRHLEELEQYPFVRVADIYHAFTGNEPQLLSFDHIHPNPIGYRIMADVTASIGFDPFLPA